MTDEYTSHLQLKITRYARFQGSVEAYAGLVGKTMTAADALAFIKHHCDELNAAQLADETARAEYVRQKIAARAPIAADAAAPDFQPEVQR